MINTGKKMKDGESVKEAYTTYYDQIQENDPVILSNLYFMARQTEALERIAAALEDMNRQKNY